VGGAVYQPREVQRQAEAQHGAGEEADAQRAAHHVVGEDHGQGEAADGHNHKVHSKEIIGVISTYNRGIKVKLLRINRTLFIVHCLLLGEQINYLGNFKNTLHV